jgi:hypothetical protein
MTLYKIGTEVEIWQSDGKSIKGHVHAITIRESGVIYNVVWWNGDARHDKWLAEYEVRDHARSEKHKIGFASNVANKE